MNAMLSATSSQVVDRRFEIFLTRVNYFTEVVNLDPIHAVILAHHYTDRNIGQLPIETQWDPTDIMVFLQRFGSWAAVSAIKPIIGQLYAAGFQGSTGGGVNVSFSDRMSFISNRYRREQLKAAHLLILAQFFATESGVAALGNHVKKTDEQSVNPDPFSVSVFNMLMMFGGFLVSDWAFKTFVIGLIEEKADGGVFDGYVTRHVEN